MIKKLTIDDLQDVYDLLRPFFDEGHWSRYGEFSPENTVSYIASFLETDYCNPLGYYDGALKGLIVVDINYEFHNSPMGYVTNFYLAKDARATGISRMLVEKALELCNNSNCINVYAANTGIWSGRANALFDNLFNKYGFEKFSNLLIREM